MNELEEIMNGKHEIKHLKIDNDTLTFNTELNNYDWNLTPRDIEMIIYALQEDKNNLQSKIDKAIEYYETHQQECVIGRNRDDKLIKDYYLPAQCSKKLYEFLKEAENVKNN